MILFIEKMSLNVNLSSNILEFLQEHKYRQWTIPAYFAI